MNLASTLSTPPPSGISEPEATSIEALITERIRSFDLCALLELLSTCGYSDSNIEFRSHRTLLSQGHPIHDISFEPPPRKRVVITINLGLLSPQSPLPSFFLKAMDQSDQDALEDFLGYFDHHLLRARIAGQMPERDASLVGGREVSEDRLRLLRPSCPSTLQWLCALIFPEAEVRVRRTLQWDSVASPGLRLGTSSLGVGSTVGGFALIPQTGMEVTLYLDEPFTSDGTSWALEARHRFNQRLLPWLAESALFLTLLLVLRGHSSFASLRNDSHLAYDPMVGGPERDHIVVLFSGSTSQAQHEGAIDTPKL